MNPGVTILPSLGARHMDDSNAMVIRAFSVLIVMPRKFRKAPGGVLLSLLRSWQYNDDGSLDKGASTMRAFWLIACPL
jgi:hypothetical protein